ncbi:MAG: DUF4349 domain-containing protein [Oscillibacter sp.]|nr:DUF4349 domain-containing protein [Oscillibacter sp.]
MKRKFGALVAAVLLLLTACGGGGGGSSRDYNMATEAPMMEMDSEEGYYGGDSYNSSKAAAAPQSIPAPSPSAEAEARPQKLIRTAELSMETTTFEETAAALADLTDRLGGYFADSTSGERGGSGRWANYTIRIPVNNFQTFLDQASQLCHETRHHISQQDISERYYDTAGRLKTQNIKLQRLQALLEKAANMEDIITIQSAISETEQAIDDLSGTLRHYDNQVDYSTITLSLEEVYRFSNVPETPKSYPSLLGSAFADGLRDFAEWLEDITVSLAYSWPWLALIALIAFAVVKLNRRRQQQRAGGNAPRLPHIGAVLKKEKKETVTEPSKAPTEKEPPKQE